MRSLAGCRNCFDVIGCICRDSSAMIRVPVDEWNDVGGAMSYEESVVSGWWLAVPLRPKNAVKQCSVMFLLASTVTP